MAFHPFEVNAVHLTYAFLGGFVVLFGMFSLFIKERAYIGEAVIATVFGIIIGPEALNLFNPNGWGGGENAEVTNEITLEVTRVVIAIGVFAIGVELPKAYMRRHWKSIAFLLGPAMVWGWMISALLIWGLIPHMHFLTALAVAACVTPTDPILAQAVVGGKFADKHVPAHIRHILVAESGCNDGAAFPFLYLALYLILDANDGYAVGQWFYITWLYEVALGITIGTLVGFIARKLMKFSESRGLIDRQSFVAQYISMAVLTIGLTTLLGSDDLLAAFACGTAFAWDGFFNKATEDSMFSNVIDLLFNVAAFVYIGAIIPFSSFKDASLSLTPWRLVVLAICILLVRRLPIILALYRWIPDIHTLREAAFVGWFGPMGVGAIFIATLARTQLPVDVEEEPDDQVKLLAHTIQPIVAFLVLCSVLCHGLSIPFFSLTKRVHSITHTWSRTSFDRGDDPAWATHTRRINPGDKITINRDDDGVAIRANVDADDGPDDGTADRGGGIIDEKQGQQGSSSTTSDSSQTMAASASDAEKGLPRSGTGSSGDAVDDRDSATRAADDRRREEEEEGRHTPVLAEYREGDNLVRERKRNEEEEVRVEVIKNYFRDNKDSEKSWFKHPHPLRNREVDLLHRHLPHSAEKARTHLQDDETPIDELGMGMMRKKDIDEEQEEEEERVRDNEKRERALHHGEELDEERDHDESHHRGGQGPPPKNEGEKSEVPSRKKEGRRDSKSDGKPRETSDDPVDLSGEPRFNEDMPNPHEVPADDNDDEYEDIEEPRRSEPRTAGSSRPRPASGRKESYRPPTILINNRPQNRRRVSLRSNMRHTMLGSSRQEPGTRLRDAEEGTARIPEAVEEEAPSPPTFSLRPPSPPRSTSIRFAGDVNEASGSVPGQQYYRRSPSSGNPDLSLFRSQSVQSERSLRFAPDVAESSETAPGPSYYKRASPSGGNQSLSINRTQSVQSQSSNKSKRGGLFGMFGGKSD